MVLIQLILFWGRKGNAMLLGFMKRLLLAYRKSYIIDIFNLSFYEDFTRHVDVFLFTIAGFILERQMGTSSSNDYDLNFPWEASLIPGQGTGILHALNHGQKGKMSNDLGFQHL